MLKAKTSEEMRKIQQEQTLEASQTATLLLSKCMQVIPGLGSNASKRFEEVASIGHYNNVGEPNLSLTKQLLMGPKGLALMRLDTEFKEEVSRTPADQRDAKSMKFFLQFVEQTGVPHNIYEWTIKSLLISDTEF